MGEDRSQTRPSPRRRVTVAEASELLGVTIEAVRGRIKRGTLAHERTEEGVFVFLDTDQTTNRMRPAYDQSNDQAHPNALAEELRDRIRYLERQVEEEREARRRADTLLAQLMQRIPELETPSEQARERRESPESPGPTVPYGRPRRPSDGQREAVHGGGAGAPSLVA